ncbi:LysR family transcriptional regulator [Thalassotalea sp. LPB0316]|uniref:LysR family transcriptional regulator n=1 Tax=Thalassotalea sp. LPB0316 TaxID=2769490 RepID=UPI001865AA97|nr:LysR family transcriptional regulator [Thalassotalea sp. LPB0316]QOL25618.1 LysR family transcriptional regulator [Thalassotalea sp. LPB0316]
MLNPIWLETYLTLIDTGHFTKSAEKLHMTQPGVSQHINKLEEACGHALIKRDKKSFTITEQGRLVYQYAKTLIKDEQKLFDQLNFDDPYSGKCTMACSGSVALLLYPKLLKLQRQHPNIHINLKAAPTQQILSDIKHGLIDQGIVTDIPNESFYDFEELGCEELCLLSSISANSNKDWKTMLSELGLISHPDAEHYLSLYFKQSEEQALKRLDISKIPVIGSVNQIGQILEPLAHGIGFTVIPKSVLESFHSPELIQILKANKPVMETLYLVRRKNRELPARYQVLNSLIKAVWN